MSRFKVVIPEDTIGLNSPWRSKLREMGCEIVSGSGCIEPDYLKELIHDADAIMARAAAKYTADVLSSAKKLKIIARLGVGYDNIDTDYCHQHGIYASITPQANYYAVAEHAIGLMIACSHQFLALHKKGSVGDWACRNTFETHTLTGATAGIIGLGRIGRRVAEICDAGLKMNVLGYDPYVKSVDSVKSLVMSDNMEDIFRNADVISLHLPYSEEFHHLVDAKMLSIMKPNAILINTARGGFVDEAALYDALKNRRIAGAGLDAREQEPPDCVSPLFELDNVLITPHCSALSVEVSERTSEQAASEVERVFLGQTPQWAV